MTPRSQRMLGALMSVPPRPEIERRKQLFETINRLADAHSAWLTSIPGAAEVTFDALPDSTFPAELARLGFTVIKTGDSTRVLAHAVSQQFEIAPDGTLVAPTEGSTRPTSLVVTNAGIARVEQFELHTP